MNVGYKPNHVKFIVSILLFVYFVFNYFYGYVFFQLQLPSSLCLLTVLKIDYLLSLSMYMLSGAEPHYGLGGLGPPQAKGPPPKKKIKLKKIKKNIIFTLIL
jgi:hypothetical protein